MVQRTWEEFLDRAKHAHEAYLSAHHEALARADEEEDEE